jgi:hypothetical protein
MIAEKLNAIKNGDIKLDIDNNMLENNNIRILPYVIIDVYYPEDNENYDFDKKYYEWCLFDKLIEKYIVNNSNEVVTNNSDIYCQSLPFKKRELVKAQID